MSTSSLTSDVVLIPSLGRPAKDFESLAVSLSMSGFRCISIEPRSTWTPHPTFARLADEVVSCLDDTGIIRAHIIGHAFGNRLARMIASRHPSRVDSVVLLACGGYVDMVPDIEASLLGCFDTALDPAQHAVHVQRAFFAPGNDGAVWANGWMPDVAAYQRAAVRSSRRADWWDAVSKRVLVAVPENGRRYAADHPDEVTLIEIDGAGHALLPEQPKLIESAVLQFLNQVG
jgi:pimeloyl-ACP methyl ester carboxylesterase